MIINILIYINFSLIIFLTTGIWLICFAGAVGQIIIIFFF